MLKSTEEDTLDLFRWFELLFAKVFVNIWIICSGTFSTRSPRDSPRVQAARQPGPWPILGHLSESGALGEDLRIPVLSQFQQTGF